VRAPADVAVNFFELNQAGMRGFFTRMGEQPFRAAQVMKWMYHGGVTDLDKMTNLGKELRTRLREIVRFDLPEVTTEQTAADGTIKWLLQVEGGNCIESVFIPEPDRGTLCVSSQVGCALDCSFCATGKQGFNRNLSVAEIIGQLWLADQRLGYFGAERRRVITNVVMMGMGEPLLNLDNVTAAADVMTDDLGFNLARKRVTLSTSGVVPGIYKLADASGINLAVSLHAPNDELRDVLVPINRKYPLRDLLAACRYYSERHKGDPITFEYVMLQGVNDDPAAARQLCGLLRGIPVKINLIPFNPFPGAGYTRSAMATIDQFRDILMRAGYIAITRKTRGGDIAAACGQLVGKVIPRAARLQKLNLENQV
jgi:23S rRNA (adenine2503-C2)-methyltransferase